MWNFIRPISLIRYLIVWRVNGDLVRVSPWPSAEISFVLGEAIANRLPTMEARPWRKSLEVWRGVERDERRFRIPDIPPNAAWPVEAVIFTYPGKTFYGRDEPFLWELKLMGEHADHGFFLEVVLPAMEEVGTDARWRHRGSIWGHFDTYAVYVARGRQWEPLVSAGRLDLRRKVTLAQWAEGLELGPLPDKEGRRPSPFDRINWITPLVPDQGTALPPTLPDLLNALLTRMCALIPGRYTTVQDVWNVIGKEEADRFQDVLEQSRRVNLRREVPPMAPPRPPGRWAGKEIFSPFPRSLLPYLELASILHIGQATHLGFGTFAVDKRNTSSREPTRPAGG